MHSYFNLHLISFLQFSAIVATVTVVYNDLDAGRDPEVDERAFSSRGGPRQTFPVTAESPGASPQTKLADAGSFICGFSRAGSRPTSSICHIKSKTNL